jgi:proline iminopeptidase
MRHFTRRDFVLAAGAAAFVPRGARAAVAAIDESGYVSIGGIEQWIAIRGKKASNPAIVYLHGGPAEAQSPFLSQFEPWENDFTVVNWDQRGSGKTYERYGPATPNMTGEQLVLDTLDVAEYARRRLGKTRVILVGQSWGCVLGTQAALRRSAPFAAYVGTGQPVNWVVALDDRERFARSQMEAAHDEAALAALDAAQKLSPSDAKRLSATNTWRWTASDRAYLDGQRAYIRGQTGAPKADVDAWMAGGDFSGPRLWPAITAYDARTMLDFQVPMFVIQGRDDHIASFAAAQSWMESVRAPAKRFVPIDGGHFACFTDAREFVGALNQYVRPYAA